MINNVSSIELKFLVAEMQGLINSKVDKIYQISKKEFDIRLHIPRVGKKILRILAPNYVYLSDKGQEYPDTPKGFCMFLRKRLGNSRIREIKQHNSERIVKILFETKDFKYWVVIELFGKGNLIVCDEAFKIISALETHIFKDRAVKPKEVYIFPERIDVFILGLNEFTEIVSSSDRSLVKKLAIDLQLGGIFSEEIISRSGLDKKKTELDKGEIKKLFESFSEIVNSPIKPVILRKDEKIEIFPFDLHSFDSGFNREEKTTFNNALDEVLSKNYESKKIEEREQKKVKTKYEKIFDIQSKQVESLKKKIEIHQKNAELIYYNYNDLKKLFDFIESEKKKSSWEEIKKKLKELNNKIELDIKDKKVNIDL